MKNLSVQEQDEKHYDSLVEQYKILVESTNHLHDVRESANNYWITINSLGISAISYIKDNHLFKSTTQPLAVWFFVILGIILCCTWLNSLSVVKKSIESRHLLLKETETYLPLKIFTKLFKSTQKDKGENSLTLREMLIPSFFLLGYVGFGFILWNN